MHAATVIFSALALCKLTYGQSGFSPHANRQCFGKDKGLPHSPALQKQQAKTCLSEDQKASSIPLQGHRTKACMRRLARIVIHRHACLASKGRSSQVAWVPDTQMQSGKYSRMKASKSRWACNQGKPQTSSQRSNEARALQPHPNGVGLQQSAASGQGAQLTRAACLLSRPSFPACLTAACTLLQGRHSRPNREVCVD
jgi:hypothetical protein